MISEYVRHHLVICNKVNILQNTQINKTFWHALIKLYTCFNDIIRVFLSFHFNVLIIFSMSTAIKSYFLQCLIASMYNKDHEPYPLPTVLSLLQKGSYFTDKNFQGIAVCLHTCVSTSCL